MINNKLKDKSKQLDLPKLNRTAKMLYIQMANAFRTEFDYIVIESTGECFFLATLLSAKVQKLKGIKTVTEIINGRKGFSKRKILFVTDLLTESSFSKISLTEFNQSCVAALFGAGKMRDEWRIDTRVFIGGNINTSFTANDFKQIWRAKL